MASFTYEREVAAPPEIVFDVLTDHRRYTEITPLRKAELEREGEPAPNGLGAIRVLTALPGPPMREEVIAYEPPQPLLLHDALGLPVRDHVGTVELSRRDGGTKIVYAVRTTPTVPVGGFARRRRRQAGGQGAARRRREGVRAPRRGCAVRRGFAATTRGSGTASQPRWLWRDRAARAGGDRSSAARSLAYELLKRPGRRPQRGRDPFQPQKPPKPKRTEDRQLADLRPQPGPHPLPAGARGSSRPSASSGATPSGRCSSSRRSTSAASSTSSTTTASPSPSTPTPARCSGNGGSAASTPPRRPTTGTASTSSTSSPATSSSSTRRPAR